MKPDVTAAQIREARALLGWSAIRLGVMAGICGETVSRFERGEQARPRTINAIRTALETAGIIFIHKKAGGVRLRKEKASP